MGHPGNWSERKRASVEAEERIKRRFGWWRASRADAWEPVASPLGVHLRGARLTARCSAGDCSRHVRFDAKMWIARGMGDLNLGTIKAAYLCARTPCGLAWQNEIYPEGVPLIGYVEVAGAEVVCTCTACKLRKTLTARAFVDWLVDRGRSPNVPAWSLNRTVQGACPTCGASAWSVQLRVPGQVVRAPPGVDV